MKIISLLILLITISGCQSLGLAPADTIDSKLAYAYGVHTAVLQSATDMTRAGVLSKDDDIQVLKTADTAKDYLDSALAIEKVDIVTASNKLALATTILTQLQTYLHSRGAQ